MSAEARKPRKVKRGPRKRVEPAFITKTEIGQHLCIGDLGTIDTWIADGTIPPPHSRPGERHVLWLRRHWNVYVETGEWPKAAWPTTG